MDRADRVGRAIKRELMVCGQVSWLPERWTMYKPFLQQLQLYCLSNLIVVNYVPGKNDTAIERSVEPHTRINTTIPPHSSTSVALLMTFPYENRSNIAGASH
ncbi:hypothetical protein J6590_001361 [Homalodisca vitripennis]|nr:hypothetical protein J6590_001361 [Homalodisca vitripennis]